jgi:hypothetical protein
MSDEFGKVVPFRVDKAFWNDRFEEPLLPPLLVLRKSWGLTLEEAAGMLLVTPQRLTEEESLAIPHVLRNFNAIYRSYMAFYCMYGGKREFNIVHSHLTLREVRRQFYPFHHGVLGNMYGGFTGLQWYHFETHDAILPREILETLEGDVAAEMEFSTRNQM